MCMHKTYIVPFDMCHYYTCIHTKNMQWLSGLGIVCWDVDKMQMCTLYLLWMFFLSQLLKNILIKACFTWSWSLQIDTAINTVSTFDVHIYIGRQISLLILQKFCSSTSSILSNLLTGLPSNIIGILYSFCMSVYIYQICNTNIAVNTKVNIGASAIALFDWGMWCNWLC